MTASRIGASPGRITAPDTQLPAAPPVAPQGPVTAEKADAVAHPDAFSRVAAGAGSILDAARHAADDAVGTAHRVQADAVGVLRFLALKTEETVVPGHFEAEDSAAVAAVADAIRRHDEPGVAAILSKAGPRLATRLWEADLPAWVAPGQYLETLKTGPADSWRVKWNYDFNTPHAAAELAALAPPLKPALDVLNAVKKNFPAAEQHGSGFIQGGTTTAYDPAVPGSGVFTPNHIRMATSPNHRTGQEMPVALMTYSQPPWFNSATGVGFNDEFKALTPNIILAKGRVTTYSNEDLHGAAAAVRPLASRLMNLITHDQRDGVSPQFVRFWMQRVATDPQETPVMGTH